MKGPVGRTTINARPPGPSLREGALLNSDAIRIVSAITPSAPKEEHPGPMVACMELVTGGLLALSLLGCDAANVAGEAQQPLPREAVKRR